MNERALQFRRGATYAAFALLSCCTLALELLLTRVMSVRFTYHFAFAVISLALFGLTAGAVFVHLIGDKLDAAPQRIPRMLVGACLQFGLWVLASFIALQAVPATTGSGLWNPGLLAVYVIAAVPFAFAGVCFCLLLTRLQPVAGLYAADLCGAATGGIVLIGLLHLVDPATGVFVLCAAILFCALLFARAFAVGTAPLAAGLCAAMLVGAAVQGAGWARVVPRLMEDEDSHFLFERWNAFSRVTVEHFGRSPFGWGFSTACAEPMDRDQHLMLIDRVAGTPITRFAGDLSTLAYLRCDVTNGVHLLKRGADVLVIGLGGGRDVLAALQAGQRHVTAVEVNELIVDLMQREFAEFSGNLVAHPAVTVVNDEARSFVARSQRRFDVIQISLVDTFAASSSGAFALTENGLYTVEGFETFLRHLDDDGILSVSRWHYWEDPPFETLRLAGIARAALEGLGISSPSDKVVLVAGGHWDHWGERGTGTLLVKKSGFTPREVATLSSWADEMGFRMVYAPRQVSDDRFARLLTAPHAGEFYASSELDITPPTDDRPYYFLMRANGAQGHAYRSSVVYTGALENLRGLLLGAGILSLFVILVPVLARERLRIVMSPTNLLGGTFFICMGFAFMTIEVAQLQRLTTLLGHPSYAFTVVLSTLLVCAGLGSLWIGWRLTPAADVLRLGSGVGLGLLVTLALMAFFTAPAVRAAAPAPAAVRFAVAVALLAPAGFVMGMLFPLGMSVARRSARSATAWFWALNGASSVLSSILAVVISVHVGVQLALLTGMAAYAFAIVSFLAYARVVIGASATERSPAAPPLVAPGLPPLV